VMSALAVHSLHRVVRRNEHEALLQDPRFWDPMRQAARVGSRFDGLSRNYSSSEFDSRSERPQGGILARTAEVRNRRSWQWDARLSQSSDHAMLSHGSICSTALKYTVGDLEEEARRDSCGSMSSKSIHSEELDYSVPPLTVEKS